LEEVDDGGLGVGMAGIPEFRLPESVNALGRSPGGAGKRSQTK
jgi:hypothetical protein